MFTTNITNQHFTYISLMHNVLEKRNLDKMFIFADANPYFKQFYILKTLYEVWCPGLCVREESNPIVEFSAEMKNEIKILFNIFQL